MKRRQRTQSAAAVSMFPFLAVLLCTMGALILLLVLLAQQAKLQAASIRDESLHEAKVAEKRFDKVRLELQNARAHLRRELEEIGSTLAEERLALSHIEDHARELRKRLRELESQLATLEEDPSRQDATDDLMIRLKQIREEIAELQVQSREAEEKAAKQQVSYAIVPYEGNSQTLRRPIYIECRSDAVILQPEGIRLSVADFQGPLDPSNPLAAALRSANEFFAENALAGQGPMGEPYPFFLVRPDGVVAYAVARSALRSWGSEFGYELVEQDWNLKYQPLDPGLAEAERAAVQHARERQIQLARIAPAYYGRRRPTSFENFDGGPGSDDDQRGRGGSGHGGGRGDFVGSGDGPSGGDSSQANAEYGSEPHDARNTGDLADGTNNPGATPGATPGADTLANSGNAGGNGPNAGGASSNSGGATADGSANGQGGSDSGGSPSGSSTRSLADSRGHDWAMSNSPRGSIGIRRPIRIYCRADHLVVMPDERGQRQGKIIPLGNRTVDAVDDLVAAVRNHMDAWETAGEGMHWRPELRLQGEAGAEQRVNDLARILQNSGMDIRVDPPSNVVRMPPLRRTR